MSPLTGVTWICNMGLHIFWTELKLKNWCIFQGTNPREMCLTNKAAQITSLQSSRGGLGGKAMTMFKHSCHFSPGGSNPAWGINTVSNAPTVYPWTVIWPYLSGCQSYYLDPQTNIITFSLDRLFAKKCCLCAKRLSKIVFPPKEMLFSFSIVWFLTNYDITNREH